MAITVVSDPLDPSANSYVSLAEVLLYLTDRAKTDGYRVAWNRLSTDQQSRLAVNATRLLDSMTTWIGDRYWYDQKLSWPRSNAYYDGYLLDNTEFPERIKDATCEMIMWMMENDESISVGENAQFDRIKIGPIEIDFNEQIGGASKTYCPDIVAYLLEGYGAINSPNIPGANRLKQAKLSRA